MKAVVIDDEKNNRELISNLLKMFCPEVELCGDADSVLSGFQLITDVSPELVFLDIEMRDGTGFDLLKCFSAIDFKVVFVTAHQEFAIEAFKVNALDYLMKPISPAAIISSVNKAKEEISKEELNRKVQHLLQAMPGKEVKRVVLKTLDRIYSIDPSEIIRFESDGNYTKAYLKDGTKIMVSRLLKEFDGLLSDTGFIRIHQSHLINSAYLYFYEKSENMLVLKDNSRVPVAARKKDIVLSLLNTD